MPSRKPFADATARRHERRDRDFDLRHLRAEITLEPEAGRIAGRVTQTFAPLHPDATVLVLDAVELTIHAVTGPRGEALAFAAAGDRLRIELGQAFAEGESFIVTIDYEGRPRTGLWFIGPDPGYPDKPRHVWTQGEQEDTRYWLPTWDFPSDRATTEVIATVPETWVAISNGLLAGTTADPARKTRTFHWRQDVPHVTYLVSLVAGEMDEVVEKSASGVPLHYLVPRGHRAEIERSFGRTPDILEFFQAYLGVPYPYPRYSQAVVYDFTFGGMENTSATTLTDRTLHDERAHLDYRSEPLVAHELAHQWWGDLVTCKSWEHLWLNEGFATYFEALWQEKDEGPDELAYNLLEKADRYFREDEEDYRRPIVERVYTDAGDLFDRHAYEKAAVVVHMLRTLLGEEPFRKGLRAYLERHRERLTETADLRIALEEATGRNLGWFFEQWLERPGYPELEVETSFAESSRTLAVRIRQTQDGADGTPIFRLPIAIRVWSDAGPRDVTVELRQREERLTLPCPAPPRAITVDPGNAWLKKLRFERPVEWLEWEIDHAEAAIDRALAARALGPARSPGAIAVLGRVLASDRFWGVRAQAARALGRSPGVEGTLAALLPGLADADSRVRSSVCEALGELREPAAHPDLVRVLGEDPSYYARAEAAKALGRLRGVAVLETLRGALAQSSHQDIVRQRVFDGLIELDDKTAIPIALEWSAYGRPPKAREAAIKALGKLGHGQPDHRQARETLERLATSDPYLWARRAAIEALGELRDEASLPVLERAARVELDSRLRRAAREAGAKLRARPAVDEQLRREVAGLRAEAADLGRRLSSVEVRRVEER